MKRCQICTVNGRNCSLLARRGKFCKRHSRCDKSVLEILKQLNQERKKGIYKTLTGKKREIIRKYYQNNVHVPSTKKTNFLDKSGNIIAYGFNRLVVGDHGAYYEFKKDQINLKSLRTKKGQEWRNNNNSNYVKYKWKETQNGTKVYEQLKTVRYADYKPGFYYVDPKDMVCELV